MSDATCFAQASIGLAVYPQDGTDVESLLRSADIAMYRSKTAGRGGVTYFEEAMNLDAQRRLLVEQRLRVALRCGDLAVELPGEGQSQRRLAGAASKRSRAGTMRNSAWCRPSSSSRSPKNAG